MSVVEWQSQGVLGCSSPPNRMEPPHPTQTIFNHDDEEEEEKEEEGKERREEKEEKNEPP